MDSVVSITEFTSSRYNLGWRVTFLKMCLNSWVVDVVWAQDLVVIVDFGSLERMLYEAIRAFQL